MRVALDVEPLRPPLTGIGRYTLELARALPAEPAIAELRLLAAWRLADDTEQAMVRLEALGGNRRQLPGRLVTAAWRRVRGIMTRRLLRRAGADLFHGPNYALPRVPVPGVVTVHDLSHIYYPETHPAQRIRYLNRTLPLALERAGAVITVSEAVRRELLEWFRIAPERVHAVHNGVSSAFTPTARDSTVLRGLGLEPGGYVLSVGTLEPRKNIHALLAAHRRLPASLRRRFPLAVAGTDGWRDRALQLNLARAAERGDVIRLGYVADACLPALYAGARALAYPSRYEGFGLPVLEGLASGVPTVTSCHGALAEVAGEAALLVEPDDVEAIASALEQLLTDDGLRRRLIGAGPARARRFTWQATAAGTIQAYHAALGMRQSVRANALAAEASSGSGK